MPSPAALQAHRMSALAPIELPKRVRLPTPSTISTVAEAENAFEEVFNRPHPFDCLEMVEARIPGRNVAYNKTFALRRRMERAADEYLTVVNETAVECEHNVDVLDYQQLLNCRIEYEIGYGVDFPKSKRLYARAQLRKKVIARQNSFSQNPAMVRLPPMDCYGRPQHSLEGSKESSPKAQQKGKAFYYGDENFITEEDDS